MSSRVCHAIVLWLDLGAYDANKMCTLAAGGGVPHYSYTRIKYSQLSLNARHIQFAQRLEDGEYNFVQKAVIVDIVSCCRVDCGKFSPMVLQD